MYEADKARDSYYWVCRFLPLCEPVDNAHCKAIK